MANNEPVVSFSNHSYWAEFFKRAYHKQKYSLSFKKTDLLEIIWCLENDRPKNEGEN